MINKHISISKIGQPVSSRQDGRFYSVLWLTGEVENIEIDGVSYEEDIVNSMFFLNPKYRWSVNTNDDGITKGYVMNLSESLMNEPVLNRLQINKVRILHPNVIHKAQLAPGIEIRVKSVLEMLDELITTNLNHRDDAIKALLHTFFIYCDGQCNIRSTIDTHNRKAMLVYQYKRLLSRRVTELQKVSDYARLLNVSSTYLNECVREIMGASAKSLIIEQLVMRTRHALKFTDKSSKEIAFELGFSSPDYFSTFCKKHTGCSPSDYRKT